MGWLKRFLRQEWYHQDEWEKIVSDVNAFRVSDSFEEAVEFDFVRVSIYRHTETGGKKAVVRQHPRSEPVVRFYDEFDEDPITNPRLSDATPFDFTVYRETISTMWTHRVDYHFAHCLAKHDADDYVTVGFEKPEKVTQ